MDRISFSEYISKDKFPDNFSKFNDRESRLSVDSVVKEYFNQKSYRHDSFNEEKTIILQTKKTKKTKKTLRRQDLLSENLNRQGCCCFF